MGKHYSFDTDVAKVVGVDGAVLLENIAFWVDKNRANEVNFYDGYYWTYNSMNAFTELFPFWSLKQVRRILNNLTGEYLLTGNYNKSPYDRTLWYTLSPKALEMVFGKENIASFFQCSISEREDTTCPNGQMKKTEWANEKDQTGTPIPYIKPYVKTTDINEKQLPSQAITPSNQPKASPKKPRNIVPPTLEMVKDYIHESCYDVNPQRFMDYYDSIGWCVGKKKMKDWQAAVRTWHNRSKENQPSNLTRSQQINQNVESAKQKLQQIHSWEEDLENV